MPTTADYQLLYVNLTTKTPSASVTGAEYRFPTFSSEEKRPYALRFLQVDSNTGRLMEVFKNVRSIHATVTLLPDARPTIGETRLQIGEGVQTPANTTEALPFNVGGQALQRAINALTAVVGAHGLADVKDVPGGFRLIFANATGPVKITPRDNTLGPVSFVRVKAWQLNGVWVHEIRFVVASVAATTTQGQHVFPEVPRIEPVRDGGTDTSGTVKTTEVQRLVIPPTYRSPYYIRRTETNARTDLLGVTDRVAVVQAALNKIGAPEGGSFFVSNVKDDEAIIEFLGDYAGVDQELLQVVAADEDPQPDNVFLIDMETAGVWQALAASPSVSAFFEVVAYIANADADESDPGVPVQLFKRQVTIERGLTYAEQTVAANPNWLVKPSPKDFTPGSESQVLTGNKYMIATKGDGAATSFAMAHNFGATLGGCYVRENIDGGRLLRVGKLVDGDEAELVFDNNNLWTVNFAAAPANNGVIIGVFAAVPIAGYAEHDHDIEDINNLQDMLDELTTRLVAVEEKYESVGVPATSTSVQASVIALPATATALFLGDNPNPWGGKGIDLSKLPKLAPFLLPAVHDISPTNSSLSPKPTPGTNKDQVFINQSGGTVRISPGGLVTATDVPANGYVLSDGRCLYEGLLKTGTNSYYPKAFDVQLFDIPVSERLLRVNRTLDVQFGIELLVAGALVDTQAQWVLVMELGTISADAAPSPIGANLKDVVWSATPIFAEAIKITALSWQHFFGVRIKRTASAITLDQMIEGVWEGNNAAAPATANFFLRSRLTQWDTENLPAKPRGWPCYRMIGSMSTAEDGTQTIKPAQALIY